MSYLDTDIIKEKGDHKVFKYIGENGLMIIFSISYDYICSDLKRFLYISIKTAPAGT